MYSVEFFKYCYRNDEYVTGRARLTIASRNTVPARKSLYEKKRKKEVTIQLGNY